MAEPQTTSVSGQMRIGEVDRYARQASLSLWRVPWPAIMSTAIAMTALLLSVAVCMILEGQFDFQFPPLLFLMVIVGGLYVGLLLGRRLARRFALKKAVSFLGDRGVPPVSDIAFKVDDTGFSVLAQHWEMTAAWPALTQVREIGPYWVVYVVTTPIYLPKRLFSSATHEMGFVGHILGHLTPAARRRSQKAYAAVRAESLGR